MKDVIVPWFLLDRACKTDRSKWNKWKPHPDCVSLSRILKEDWEQQWRSMRSQCRGGQCHGGSRLQQKLWKRRTLPPPPVKKKCGIIYTHIYVCVYVYHKPTISETLIFGQLWGTRATSSPMCGQVSIDMFVYTYNNYSSKNLGYVEHLK